MCPLTFSPGERERGGEKEQATQRAVKHGKTNDLTAESSGRRRFFRADRSGEKKTSARETRKQKEPDNNQRVDTVGTSSDARGGRAVL